MTASLTIALCDLGLGNIRSVQRALELSASERKIPVRAAVTRDPAVLRTADRIVVPGQGAFRDGSRAIAGAMGDALRDAIARGTPYLGICLGLQLLFEHSDEAPGASGLGVLKGTNRRLVPGHGADAVKIPHMGWNELVLADHAPGALRQALEISPWMYFVHSFHAVPDESSVVCASVVHGENVVTAAVARGSVLATQFHPEKSQRAGLVLLGSFVAGDT